MDKQYLTKLENIAKVCHEVNRAYCVSIGDNSQVSWDEAEQWQKDSAMNGVKFHLENDVTPEQSHENWMAEKLADGWAFGTVKDPSRKLHPCIVPYNELPLEQRVKDYLFKAVVDQLKNTLDEKFNEGLNKAIDFIRKRYDTYVEEHGSYDPSTGMTEFPGNGDETVAEWEEIIEGLVNLKI